MTEKLIKTIKLNDLLELNIVDASREVAGDRWQVCMEASMDVPVEFDPIFLKVGNADEFRQFQGSVGKRVRYEQKRVRNFIDRKNKNSVLRGLVDSFLQGGLAYLSHPDFPKKYVMKQYRQHMKKKTWAHLE